LAEYNSATENHVGFAWNEAGADLVFTCSVDPARTSPCLNKVITAKYNPLPAPNGVGPTDYTVSGFLWLTPASSPFNYSDMPLTCLQQLASFYPGGVLPPLDLSTIISIDQADTWCSRYPDNGLFVWQCRDG
jgi:hypothetical protein